MGSSGTFSGQWQRGWRKSLRAARFNLLPGTLLLAAGILLVYAYYQVPVVAAALNEVTAWREQVGFIFPVISTAIFGGIFPQLVRRVFLGQKESLGGTAFYTAFWAYKGLEVSLFYELQAILWGTGTDTGTLVAKVLTDQFVYCPFLAIPNMTLAYLWRDSGFSGGVLRARLREVGFLERAVPICISNWVVWIPAVSIIYAFPLPLQVPLQNIILSIFVLVLTLVSANEPPSDLPPEPAPAPGHPADSDG